MTVGARIKVRRKELGLTTERLSEKVGVSRATMFRWQKGSIENTNPNMLPIVASALNTSPEYLLGITNDPNTTLSVDNLYPVETKQFPLLGAISCAEATCPDQTFHSYSKAGAEIQADFCMRCKDDSMANARIYSGDIVFIRKQPIVGNGEIAAVIIENEATLKRVYYYPEKGRLILQAANPTYEPLIYVGSELGLVRILGKAVAFQSDAR